MATAKQLAARAKFTKTMKSGGFGKGGKAKGGKAAKPKAPKMTRSGNPKGTKADYQARVRARQFNRAAHLKQIRARKSYKGGNIPLSVLKSRAAKLNRLIKSRKG